MKLKIILLLVIGLFLMGNVLASEPVYNWRYQGPSNEPSTSYSSYSSLKTFNGPYTEVHRRNTEPYPRPVSTPTAESTNFRGGSYNGYSSGYYNSGYSGYSGGYYSYSSPGYYSYYAYTPTYYGYYSYSSPGYSDYYSGYYGSAYSYNYPSYSYYSAYDYGYW